MTALPNPWTSAPETSAPQAAPEREPSVTPASPGADTRFELNVMAFVYAIDQRSVDWDLLPAFIASPSAEYLAMLEAAE